MRTKNAITFILTMFFSLLLFTFVVSNNYNQVFANNEECRLITGTSRPISPNSLVTPMNEGVLNFNLGNTQYRGCVQKQTMLGSREFVIKGWVWNTNLGWVSLGSFANNQVTSRNDLVDFPNGLTPNNFVGRNNGISTGSIAYSSMVNLLEDPTVNGSQTIYGSLNGYWWGDNTGWISLNCDPYYSTETSRCATSQWRVSIVRNATTPADKYELAGYAWSNSVGWIDMTGVLIELPTIGFNDISARVYLNNESTSSNPNDKVYANGVDGIRLGISFFHGTENITASLFEFLNANPSIKLCAALTDNRLVNNTPGAARNTVNQELGTMGDCSNQTLTRFNRFFPSNFNSQQMIVNSQNFVINNSGTGLMSRNLVRSLVPSDNFEFKIENFIFDNSSAQINVPIVSSVTDLVFDNPLDLNIKLGRSNVTLSECFNAGLDSFRLTIGVLVDFSLCGQYVESSLINSPQLRLAYSGKEGIASTELDFFFCEDCSDEESLTTDLVVSEFSNPVNRRFSALVSRQPESETPFNELSQQLLNLGVETRLSYNLANSFVTVTRVGPVLNQAYFRVDSVGGAGGIDSRAFTQIGAGPGAGSASGAMIRDNFVKRVFDVVSAGSVNQECIANNHLSRFFSEDTSFGGTNNQGSGGSSNSGSGSSDPFEDVSFGSGSTFVPGVGNVSEQGNIQNPPESLSMQNQRAINFFESCQPNNNVNLHYVNNTSANRILVDYSTIRGFFTDNANKRQTLVLVGYDLYFGSDILSESGNFPSIVLFRNNSGIGGNVYIGSNVTELTANIYADRSIFSVQNLAAARNVSSTGVPSALGNSTAFYNEIAFIGRFFSENCVGCALETPPRKGDGSIARDFNEARPFDLGYFRFSSLMVKTTFEEGIEFYLNCDGTNSFVQVGSGNPDQYLCWHWQGSGVQRVSPYLQSQRTATSSPDNQRRAVNFVFKQLARTPVFTN